MEEIKSIAVITLLIMLFVLLVMFFAVYYLKNIFRILNKMINPNQFKKGEN